MLFVQGFHLVATAIFVLGSALIGFRLVWLARQTRELPELLLGAAILGTAVFGYGVLIVGLILRSTVDADPVPGSLVFLSGLGKTSHDLGVALFLVFVVRVFRPRQPWAWALAGGAIALMTTGLVWGALEGSFRVDNTRTAAWWCEYAVIWTYSLWLFVESLRYWGLMRKRAGLGLADPMVTNRFLLWGGGSLFTFLATAIASIPFLLIDDPARVAAAAPTIYVATALAGLCSVSCTYLAFLPPAWFERIVRARSTGRTG